MKDTIDAIVKYFLGGVLAVVGYLLANAFTRTEAAIANLQLEVVSMKLQITKLEAKIIDEARIIEIHNRENAKNRR